MNKNKLIIAFIVVTLLMAFFAFDLGRFLSFEAVTASRAELVAAYERQPVVVAGGYFLAYVVMTALSLPAAAIMTLLAGAIFGVGLGTVLVSFASTLGATIAFVIAKIGRAHV